MKYFITFILGIICGPHTGTGSEIPIINVLGMEQEDRFGLKSIPAILMGVNIRSNKLQLFHILLSLP
jgi:hypothetical protein